MLYDRTFNEVVYSQAKNKKQESKTETKAEFDLKKIAPYILILLSTAGITLDLYLRWVQVVVLAAVIIWSVLNTWSLTRTKSTNTSDSDGQTRKSLYDDEIAEHHLFDILKDLKAGGYKLLVIFDEMDKLDDDTKITGVISDLKPLLLSGYANYMVVAGQSLYYELEKSNYMDDLVISTLFSRTVHVSFLKNATLKKYCLSLIVDETDKSNPLVNDYFDSLILRSGRIPRKLVNLLRSAITWTNTEAAIIIDEGLDDELRWRSRILQAAAYAVDNELANMAKNNVQLDFFTAQAFLWLSKMMSLFSIRFEQNDIYTAKQYGELYPAHYINDLDIVWDALINSLVDERLLKVVPEQEDPRDLFYSWIITPRPAASGGTTPLDDNPLPPQPASPDNGPDEEPDEPEISEELISRSLFLTDFADLEA
ncbi:hypothetical protein [Mucilaginibacter phyllosphaerae]